MEVSTKVLQSNVKHLKKKVERATVLLDGEKLCDLHKQYLEAKTAGKESTTKGEFSTEMEYYKRTVKILRKDIKKDYGNFLETFKTELRTKLAEKTKKKVSFV